jgi:FlaA1/EpsC-like NDP-sugar epimerase
MEKFFKDKTILITGGTGSIGEALVEEVLKFAPRNIRIYSRDETKQHELMERLGYPKNISALIGDIRDYDRLLFALKGVDIVFHAAAMKHVHISEYNPFEVVKTNILGSQNLINASVAQGVKKVVAISTDKAVNPSGVLGTSKLMMEKLFINANNYIKRDVTRFSCVRFGNVIWSRGSVLPSWQKRAKKESAIRVTNGEMTRFFMTAKQAAYLVLRSAVLTEGGEIFIFKMPSVKLRDLAGLFIGKYFPGQDIKIEELGKRDGEKLDEELFDQSDLSKDILADDEIFIVPPEYRNVTDKSKDDYFAYEGFKPVEKFCGASSSEYLNPKKIEKMI